MFIKTVTKSNGKTYSYLVRSEYDPQKGAVHRSFGRVDNLTEDDLANLIEGLKEVQTRVHPRTNAEPAPTPAEPASSAEQTAESETAPTAPPEQTESGTAPEGTPKTKPETGPETKSETDPGKDTAGNPKNPDGAETLLSHLWHMIWKIFR